MRQAVLWSLVVSCMWIWTTPAAAERNWELSIGGYGGWGFHGDTTFQANQLINVSTGLVEPADIKEPIFVLKTLEHLAPNSPLGICPENTAGNRKSD